VYGYSQSATVATVATVEKRFLAQNPVPGTTVGFNLIANPNRPDGGILERFAGLYIPIVGVTFNGATPTDTGMPTVDVAREYDGWADFPTNPLNPLADVKAGLGIDPPKKPTTPTVGKPLGPGLGGPQQAGLVQCGRAQEFLGEDAGLGWRRSRLDRRQIAESAAG
jgi:hypothetical protein